MNRQIILASTSVFRRDLLARLQIPFLVADPSVDEIPLPSETPHALALRLAEAKARAVAAHYPLALIIGSDQVAIANGKLYGKPGNHANAVLQLQTLSGQAVEFYTAICLFDTQKKVADVGAISTLVTFRTLTTEEIERYLEAEPAYNCAGSAKSEGLGISLLKKMEGDDPTALIGLPLILLCEKLRSAGVAIP